MKTKLKIKPTLAWAVVKKKKMKISPLDIFGHKDLALGEDEVIIRVKIEQVK